MEDSSMQSPHARETDPLTVRSQPAEGLSSEDGVDIIVHSLSAKAKGRPKFKLTSEWQLIDFLGDEMLAKNQYLMLIEDISPEVIRVLSRYLHIQEDVFEHHTRGRVNSDDTQQVGGVLHAKNLASTLLGRASAKKDKYSLTWWKLQTHSLQRYTYEREALTESGSDATKVVVPHFSVHISDTRRQVGSGNKHKTQVNSAVNELRRQWKKTKGEAELNHSKAKALQVEETEDTIFKLHCNTYRAHQVISEVKHDVWGAASEERLSYVKASRRGSTFYIFLFDKDRTLQKITQLFATDYSNARSFGILDSVLQDESRKPTTKLIEERMGELVSTFITSSESKEMPITGTTGHRRESRIYPFAVDTDASRTLSDSASEDTTRHRFLHHISQQGFLNLPDAQNDDNSLVLRVQLAFTRVIAEDWNLVLSQMSQTLDDIDRKMSDNDELRRNVLAWRRLLGSWRVTIIEYRAKLSETDQFLRSQMHHSAQSIGTSPSPSGSRASEEPGGDDQHGHTRIAHQSINSELEDILNSYQILTNGIEEVESRVERSFLALMSSMSIIESQKAIVQGSAVARLTELAFIFIPLNFACTFFSMQITNFQGDSQPNMGSFFGLAIPLMLMLYGIRAFIRSQLLYDIKQKLETKIRDTSKIPGTSEIPTRVIVSFGWQQLGPFSRALLIVVPLAIIVLVLIITLSQWIAYRVTGSLVTVLGTLVIISFLAIESYVPALQATAITTWLISILGICLGRIEPLNTAVMATLCTIVTTVFVMTLAFIPQTITEKPKQRAIEILLPLWLVELPIAIIVHYYKISSPQWKLWILLIGIFSVFIVFGFVVAFSELEVYSGLPQIAALAAFTIGFPIVLVWLYAPFHGNHLPLYGAIIITFASVVLFFFLLKYWENTFDNPDISYAYAIFFLVLGCVVAVPITLVWDTLPSHGIDVPRWAQISISCGSSVLFAAFIAFIRPFSRHLKWLAWCIGLGATAAWLPTMLWAGDIKAFKGLTDNRTNTIHVTWTSVLFWIIAWGLLAFLAS